MTDQEEVAPEEVQEVAEEQSQVEEKQPEAPKESKAEINWRQANEALRAQKAEIEALRAELNQKTAPPPVVEKDEFDELDQSDYLTVAQARKLAKAQAAKEAQEAAKAAVGEYARAQNVANDETRARSKFEDYDYVVENFAIPLIKNDPALAHKVANSKNPAETAYKLGKLSDHYEEQMAKQEVSPKAEKIIKNSQRPTSSNAAATSLKSQADQFSKMTPREIWEQSQKWAKGA